MSVPQEAYYLVNWVDLDVPRDTFLGDFCIELLDMGRYILNIGSPIPWVWVLE